MTPSDILERLEKATGPDRELDDLIGAAAFGTAPVGRFSPGSRVEKLLPRYTASLDAAVALVEKMLPGWQWAVWGGAIEVGATKPRCIAHISDGLRAPWTSGEAANAPIAILQALFRSLQANANE